MTRYAVLFLVVASSFSNLAAVAAEEGMATESLTYTITDNSWEGNPPTKFYVSQWGHKTVARQGPEPDSYFAIVSDPSNGIHSAGPNPGGGLPILRSYIDGLPGLNVGDQIDFGWRTPRKIEFVHFALERGKRDEEVSGRQAIHSVLSVELKMSPADPDDTNTAKLVHAIGKADLWTIPELPFSWVPYTSPDAFSNAAVPLSRNDPKLAGFLLDHFSQQLQDRGLLVRAEVESKIHNYYDDPRSLEPPAPTRDKAELLVTDIQVSAAEVNVELPSMAMLTGDRYQLVMGMAYAAWSAGCNGDAVIGRLALESGPDGPGPILGEGEARVIEVGGNVSLAMTSFSTSDTGSQLINCALIIFVGSSLAAGDYYITAQKPDESVEHTGVAAAFLLSLEGEELHSITIMEAGNLVLSEERESILGELAGRGYRLVISDQESSVLEEGVDLKLHFGVLK